ncbi:hypothetical protein K490DRAFT_66129 [Saccharata proteae CBS 121410]|uniref:Uncharacterized protein n=1 Tax=Saccharata proteae CBS 121410 TaxID=1314787 RepID=A0A9P4HUQ9_9PEZI|nr:hypothetical protein K490DRAFT_66129 [Saccharata proteae CBS 121410]
MSSSQSRNPHRRRSRQRMVYRIKHSSKKPFMEETSEGFTDCLTTYTGRAPVLGAVRGVRRASVRQLAQTLARETSEKGVHVVHTIANGSIVDEEGEEQKMGKKMSAEAVVRTYLWLTEQGPELWTDELDMRPACEKF